MKKNKLNLNYDIDYHILALVSPVNDYRLVHFLNKITAYKFTKKTGLNFNLPQLTDCNIDYYIHNDVEDKINLIFFKNKYQNEILFKKFNKIDYFLLIELKTGISVQIIKEIQKQISQLSIIQAIFVLEKNQLNLKNKLNFE